MQSSRPYERILGRYAIFGEIASGGMATVYAGRLLGPVGFSRRVAIKSLHPQYAKDPDFLSMFLDEARLTGRIRHPHVVSIHDLICKQNELHLVMDYVEGESLSRLVRRLRQRAERIPLPCALSIMIGVLDGLHAAHEARDDSGAALGIVHRDVSPQNILVGSDGVARVLDFGIAKAVGRMQSTRGDQLKGKLSYMAPEQLGRAALDRRADIYAASIVLWELITGQRLFQADDEISTFKLAIEARIPAPSTVADAVPELLDRIVLKGLARQPEQRFRTAAEMAMQLEALGLCATAREVADWMRRIVGNELREHTEHIAACERAFAALGDELPEELDTQGRPQHPLPLALRVANSETRTDILPATGASNLPLRAQASVTDTGELPSLATPADNSRPKHARSRRLLASSAILLMALVAIGLVIARLRSQRIGRAVAAAQPEPRALPVAPSASTAATSAMHSQLNASDGSPPPTAVSQKRQASQASASPTKTPGRAKARSSKQSNLAKNSAKNDCDNPFTVDATGVRVPKVHCL